MDFKQVKENEEKAVLKNKNVVDSDFWRQKYHIQGIVGLINDPNGFSQFNGEYHMFYQWNPLSTEHKNKTWAHSKSYDLLHWERCETALRPDTWYSKNGVYSGSGIVIDGKLYLFYTGNVKDAEGNRESYQCIAVSEDGEHFDRWEPSIVNQPDGYTRHIRDPKIWEKDGKYYAVLGIQSEKLEGKVVLYSSENIKDWKFEGEIAGANHGKLKDFGFMWECPDYFEVDGKEIFMFSPQGITRMYPYYENVYQIGYSVVEDGIENVDKLDNFTLLDYGHDFYAAQTFLDEDDNRVLIGWMYVPDSSYTNPTVKFGYQNCLTVPRVVNFKDGKVRQTLHKSVKDLLGNDIKTNDFNKNTWYYKQKHGESFEISVADFKVSYKDKELKVSFGTSGYGRNDRKYNCI